MGSHRISVIIPVYNVGEYLEQCLDSVISQRIDKEVICIDDGSTDGSIEILEKYACRYQEIKCIKEEHKGTGEARNVGIKAASGEYIAFMDADDYYPYEQVLAKLYNLAVEKQASIVGGNIMAVDADGNKAWHGEYFDHEGFYDYRDGQYIYGFKKYIYSRELFRDNQKLFPPYVRFEDPPFFINIMTSNPNFYACAECVYYYRVSHKTVSYTRDNALGMLKGIRDTLASAYNNDLRLAYERHLKNKLRVHFKDYYQFLYIMDFEFWDLIDEICCIEKKWTGNVQWLFSEDEFKWRIDDYKDLKHKVHDLTTNDIPVIIYGAGYGGREVQKAFFDEYPNILGYAVTDESMVNELYLEVNSVSNVNCDSLKSIMNKCVNLKGRITI